MLSGGHHGRVDRSDDDFHCPRGGDDQRGGGVEVVLAERRIQLLDAEMLRVVGISPERRRLLVVKSAVHFRADLGQLAKHIFDGDTPGVHRPDFGNFDYRRLRRPIYPLDRVELR